VKILLIDNDVFVQKTDALCIFKSTGEFALELQNLGNEVELLQTKLELKSDFHDFNVIGTNLKITAIKRFRFKIITYFNAYLIAAWRVYNSDFVYIFYPTNYQYLAVIARLLGKGYGLNVRGQKGVDSKFSKLLYRFSKNIFTVSPMFTSIASDAGAKAYTQKPAISLGINDVVKGRVYEKKEYYKLLFVARLDEAKGVYELVEAVKKLNDEIIKFELVIVGDGPELEQLKAIVKLLKLDSIVFFYGAITKIERLKQIYIESDIFILPSYHEGFPRTLYEAMICGTPILTTFVGGIPFLMKDNENCFQIEPRSAESLSDKLRFVMMNYNILGTIASNAQELVSEIISPDRMSHAEHLNSILNGKDGLS
jgi:glycosyltransferase involved in cell wall biosynthesis